MKSKERIILQKLNSYILDVLQYVQGYTFEQFMADKKTVSACAFTVSQMGELAKYISDETQERYPDIPWRSIRGMRNRIVHDYENIDLAVLWGTITASLPELQKQIEHILLHQTQDSELLSRDEDEDHER
ncbi:DUF86 domain-containing protein [Paenibacillus sp. S150]|uniref:HepT-like ribonuclease domain-containing protein n=1 Tax=Paenibacillus sp. S150 TaxID=2749826 RepID=UPI001C59F05F|nr:HepT-like ribonuclease domain-containing protein [Paenibacillus sp. S150]MBW4085240.1 DUF86 domain-containing protein [Paenibacillus sp. S150]